MKGQTAVDFFFGVSFLLIFSLWFVNYSGEIYKSRTCEVLAGQEILQGVVNHVNSVCATQVNVTAYAACPFNKDQNYAYSITTNLYSSTQITFKSSKYLINLNQNSACYNNLNFTITNCSTIVCYYYSNGQVNAASGVTCS